MTKHTESIEVVVKDHAAGAGLSQRRRRLVRRTYEPGMSVSMSLGRKTFRLDCCFSGASSNAKVL